MSEKELWFYFDENGVAKEYDRSLDFTINFEDREEMEDFIAWLKREVTELLEKRREKNGKEKKND